MILTKQRYKGPVLVSYGSLARLTLGSTGADLDFPLIGSFLATAVNIAEGNATPTGTCTAGPGDDYCIYTS